MSQPTFPRPHSNCYWVEPGRLLAGEYPGASSEAAAREKLARHLDAGVTFFLDLTCAGELVPYDKWLESEAAARNVQVEYRRLPIRDMDVPANASDMKLILDTVAEALARDHTALVHCWGGIGRTGTVIGCYLVRQGLTGDQALAQIANWWQTVGKRHRRPHSPETVEQESYIRQWSEP